MVETFGTGRVSDEALISIINEHFDFRPTAIIQNLNLQRPIYRDTASYGHFGRSDVDLPWERLDKVEACASHQRSRGCYRLTGRN
jgi:S-adenosylmethionine synthetase